MGINLKDDRLGNTAKQLAKDWNKVRKQIVSNERLMRACKYRNGREPDQLLQHLLKEMAEEILQAELEGKEWVRKKVRKQMSKIYDIGKEFVSMPKFDTYFKD